MLLLLFSPKTLFFLLSIFCQNNFAYMLLIAQKSGRFFGDGIFDLNQRAVFEHFVVGLVRFD
jgi:hypothetical protein